MSRPRKPAAALATKPATIKAAEPVPVAVKTSSERLDRPFRDPEAEGKAFVYNPTLALPVGSVETHLPTTNPRRFKYDWAAVRLLLEDNPGLWVLAIRGLSSGMYSYVRRGGPPQFVGMGGHLQVSLRNTYWAPGKSKTRVGDLWLRWIPEGWTEDDQARAEAAHDAGEGVL